MATNEIYEFGPNATNILSNAAYESDTERDLGSQPGVSARSELNNKALKQATLVASGISQFIADNQDEDIDDSLTPAEYSDAFADAIGSGAVYITQPQFTNNTTPATTEFVQRAVGTNSSANIIDSSTYAVTADDIGAVLNTIVECELTLPLISTLNASGATGLGSKIKIQNDEFTCTINTQSPDTINAGYDGLSLTFIELAPYQSIEFSIIDEAVDGKWVVTGGSAQSRGLGDFENQLTLNGYQKTPNGMIMQWGFESAVSREGTRLVTFPISFPGAVLNLSATVNKLGGGLGTLSAYADTVSNSQFNLTLDSDDTGSSEDIYWFAIGF